MIAQIAQHKIELSFRFVLPSGGDIHRRFEGCMVVGAVAVHARGCVAPGVETSRKVRVIGLSMRKLLSVSLSAIVRMLCACW